jgi:hypothetical protein
MPENAAMNLFSRRRVVVPRMYWRDAMRDQEASGDAPGAFSFAADDASRRLIIATGGRKKGCLVRDKSPKSSTDQARPIVSPASHKFALGSFVILVGKSEQTLFKVTRLLPNG